ncbi:MAG: DUF3122 domain-containing protein [Synechococcales cyanobacterium T60_A2020_003]|nr:DUF3122 domain-containing protein [Synechococcales cyanobacterium T60_A2020_003]
MNSLRSVIRIATLCLFLVAIALVTPITPAWAEFQTEQVNGQMLYKSWQTLYDIDRHSWKAIAFRQVGDLGITPVYLRLITFPGSATVDHGRSLTLLRPDAEPLLLADETALISPNSPLYPNVAQYDLSLILSQLDPTQPIRLSLPVVDGNPILLKVPPVAIQEWQAIATCATMDCSLEN